MSYVPKVMMRKEVGADIRSTLAAPAAHRRMVWTTNMLERQNRELKKRTKTAGIFPNEESLLRLVGAILIMETSEQCLGEKRYLPIEISK